MDAFLNKILSAEDAARVLKLFKPEGIDLECLFGYKDYGVHGYGNLELDLIHVGIDPEVRAKILDAVGFERCQAPMTDKQSKF